MCHVMREPKNLTKGQIKDRAQEKIMLGIAAEILRAKESGTRPEVVREMKAQAIRVMKLLRFEEWPGIGHVDDGPYSDEEKQA